MEDQELRKLKRVELLEIMVEQGKAVGELRQQMEEQEKHIQEFLIQTTNLHSLSHSKNI